MPLLMSPIDGSPMRQVTRNGIEIDVCTASGGVWLDKGELEKLMALLREEAQGDQHYYRNDNIGHSNRYDFDDDDDHYEDRYRRSGKGGKGRKEGKMSRIMDIFDF